MHIFLFPLLLLTHDYIKLPWAHLNSVATNLFNKKLFQMQNFNRKCAQLSQTGKKMCQSQYFSLPACHWLLSISLLQLSTLYKTLIKFLSTFFVTVYPPLFLFCSVLCVSIHDFYFLVYSPSIFIWRFLTQYCITHGHPFHVDEDSSVGISYLYINLQVPWLYVRWW